MLALTGLMLFAGHFGCSLAWLSSCVTESILHQCAPCCLPIMFSCFCLVAWQPESAQASYCQIVLQPPTAIETFSLYRWMRLCGWEAAFTVQSHLQQGLEALQVQLVTPEPVQP